MATLAKLCTSEMQLKPVSNKQRSQQEYLHKMLVSSLTATCFLTEPSSPVAPRPGIGSSRRLDPRFCSVAITSGSFDCVFGTLHQAVQVCSEAAASDSRCFSAAVASASMSMYATQLTTQCVVTKHRMSV